MTSDATKRNVDALIRRCYDGLDATTLRREALGRLRRVMSIDAGFVATVDPATLLFTSAVSEEPLIAAAPLFLANELDGQDVNRFVDVAVDPFPVRWLDRATSGNRYESLRYRTIMRPLGLGDELRVALRTGETCWGVMCLHREDGRTGFDGRDAAIVARVAGHIGEGLRLASLLADGPSWSPPSGPGIVVLDEDGTVVSMNDPAERWLAEIPELDWPQSADLPLAVMSAATALRSASPEPMRPKVTLRTATGSWLSIHASLLHGATKTQTVVVLEPAEPVEITSLILDSHGVTGAQGRVVALVLRGYSTQQIVRELAISGHTVQEHLTAVFDKLGVRSRRELAAALLNLVPTDPDHASRLRWRTAQGTRGGDTL